MAAWVTSLTQVGCSLLVLFAPNFAKFSCRYCVRVMPAMIVMSATSRGGAEAGTPRRHAVPVTLGYARVIEAIR
ncbi:hypothetical protein ARMSODRAFT_947407 [Armillaria solidipes]|uniref:Secreted protein n=1 Tax=Armillaria solidipes TaxID=1076256 RepID=A0A2H3CAY2_9AGAR|nr:hypothetical protein ARMSODRAFT_947407 [Armillaria solidipes]